VQGIVDHVFPELVLRDSAGPAPSPSAEAAAGSKRSRDASPASAPAPAPGDGPGAKRARPGASTAQLLSVPCTTLWLVPSPSQPWLPALRRPFLRTVSTLRVASLKRYLATRLAQPACVCVRGAPGGDGERAARAAAEAAAEAAALARGGVTPDAAVQLRVGGHAVMGRDHTIEFLLKTLWRRTEALEVEYALAPRA
jgi:hypothetical protein